jgi:hypothetical protein
MASPRTISVDDGTIAGSVELASALPLSGKRRFIILSRSDSAADKLALSVGERNFTFATAALWVSAGERLVFTPDNILWPLVCHGIYGLCNTGITININVQVG